MKFLLLCLLPLAFSLEWSDFTSSETEAMFETWAKQYNRTYSDVDYEMRKAIFLSNAQKIYEVNNAQSDYTLGVNQFADMSAQEFREYIHGGSHGYCLKPSWKTSRTTVNKRLAWLKQRLGFKTQEKTEEKKRINVPDSVNWVTQGKVTPVKNQGQCGSCWAFSTTGSVESAFAIKTGKLVSLSEQELVDCSRSYGNEGCQGGLMDDAFKYVKARGGLCSETEYPYKGKNGICESAKCTQRYDAIVGYSDVTKDNSMALEEAVAKQPTSIAVEADQFSFQFYKTGVLTGACGTRLDHGVLAAGYGTENGKEYWLVKNSWGASWGEKGYLKICRNCNKNRKAGECGILMQPSDPTA